MAPSDLGDFHDNDHEYECTDAVQDDVHVRAGRPDRDEDGAARRCLHRLRPLPGQGCYPKKKLAKESFDLYIWLFGSSHVYLADAWKLQEHLRRGLPRDSRWGQVSDYDLVYAYCLQNGLV